MLRLSILGGILCGLLILAASCKNDSPTAPQQLPDLHIQLTGLDSSYTFPEGSLVAAAFEVTVSTTEGAPLPGVSVSSWVLSGPGNVAVKDPVTTSTGTVEALYYTTMPSGDASATIVAVVGIDTASVTIHLHGELTPAAITLEPTDQTVQTHYAESALAEVTAVVTNPDNLPVPDVDVVFSLLSGSAVVSGGGKTDDNGEARADILFDGTWFGDVELAASAVQRAGVQQISETDSLADLPPDFKTSLFETTDGILTATAKVSIELVAEIGLNFLTPDTTVYITHGEDRFSLRAQLVDTQGYALAEQPVKFFCDETYARIDEAALTDENGIAHAAVILTGEPGEFEIRAQFEPLSLTDVINIEAVDNAPVFARFMFIGEQSTLWKDSTYSFEAMVRDGARNGLTNFPLRVISDLGNADHEFYLTDAYGVAILPFTPEASGEGIITLESVSRPISVVEFNIHVYRLPMQIEDSVSEDASGHPTRVYTYNSTITDADGSPVPFERIVALTNLGWLNNSNVTTDLEGKAAIEIHWDGVQTGIATFAVSWRDYSHQWNLPFLRGSPASITLTADPLQIQPRGRGGRTISTLRAQVRDSRGALVQVPTTVIFMLINEAPPPAGCTINGENSLDSSMTSNGIAIASLHAGEQIGGKLIRAYTWTDSTRRVLIGTTLSTVAVVPGPPFSLDLGIEDEAEHWGGDLWAVRVRPIRVWDIHRNPISIIPPVNVTVDEDFVRVMPDEDGVINLIYNIGYALSRITVRVEIQTEQGEIRGERQFTLPLPEGSLQLTADPDTVFFDENVNIATVQVQATLLTDFGRLPVDNAEIHFTANRGRFYWLNPHNGEFIPYYPHPAIAVTEEGVATIYLRGAENDFFLDPFTQEVTVQVNASIDNVDIEADPVFITVRRNAPRRQP